VSLLEYEYQDFLASKRPQSHACGFTVDFLNPALYPHARAVTRWAIKKGRAAVFGGCGTHKTGIQGCWSEEITRREQKPILGFAPLVVADQTVHDLKRDYNIDVALCESMADIRPGINITNYEKLDRFSDPSAFCGVFLDESSILKSHTGKYRQELTRWASGLQYRLCCTATPSPNDHVELGTHAEFLGVMRREEMLATFFVHDGGKTSDWRLKGHAKDEFWKWVSTWAMAFQKPSDIGFSDEGFELPPLNIKTIVVESPVLDGYLFPVEANTLSEQREAKRKSIGSRVGQIADIVNASPDQWLIFSQLNDESEAVTKAIPDAVEITGSDKTELKRSALLGFLAGKIRVISSKAKIVGFGLNLQCCWNIILAGIDHSHEAMYQLIRRCWRFGQTHPVTVYALMSEAERGIWANLQRKEAQDKERMRGMIKHMESEMKRELSDAQPEREPLREAIAKSDNYEMRLGDSVQLIRNVPDESVDFSIFSPPFSSLYTYSALEEDMGNCRTQEQFQEHFDFLITQLFRILKSGRLVSFHCMNLPSSKERDGYIGIKDFRGDLIRMFERHGFIYHSEVCIWKDPVTAMQRTKALGLLHKQIRKDSCMSRQGIPDYLVTMRKPGRNDAAVSGLLEYFAGDMNDEEFEVACRAAYNDQGQRTEREHMPYEVFRSIFIWQRYASPVWMDINPSDTLQYTSAREHRDERHICPLQLQVIERALQLWTNPRDLVFSPFAGIGSEGHEALRLGRRFLGFELKESYYKQACRNLEYAEKQAGAQASLFAEVS
jgi:DNA modification methylase